MSLSRTALVFMAFAGASALPRPITSAAPRVRPRTTSVQLHAARGGATPSLPASPARTLAAGWGVCGFLGILVQAIGRLAPIALQPLIQRDLTVLQWGLCVQPSRQSASPRVCRAGAANLLTLGRVQSVPASCLHPRPACPDRRYGGSMAMFAYAEGYKAFQLKFSPLVVQRAMTLSRSPSPPLHHTLLAPFYSMGLFHASKKRKIVSWSISIGVAFIVGAVKRLPYP